MIRVGIACPAPSSAEPFAAWVPDLIGCVSCAGSEDAALAGVGAAIDAYLRHARGLEAVAPRGDIRVVERFTGWWEGDYEVNAFFRQVDLAPVTAEEADFAAALLERTRGALLRAARRAGPAPSDDRETEPMLRHVAKVEWWYATRLDESPAHAPPDAETRDVEALLGDVRAFALRRIAALPSLGGVVRGHHEERWTPRKVLRRFIYHELDHVLELERRASVAVR